MKVMIVDKFPPQSLEQLRKLGFVVSYHPDLKGQPLLDEVHGCGADALVVRSTKVTEPMLEGTKLTLIVRSGSGVDNIDVNAASRRGIYVANCPGRNAVAVAELALGLMLALDRKIADNVIQLRDKRWNKKQFAATEGPGAARGLYGRTLGIVGAGKIGSLVAERAKAFGMRVVVNAFGLTQAQADEMGVEMRELPEDVAAEGDFVSVHVPSTPETKGLCGPAFFAAMRPGAVFVNTSRGDVVDELALKKAIEEKGIKAGLDVFAKEPAEGTAPFDNELAQHGSVYGTHHIGASTAQAQEATADETVRILRLFRDTGRAPNVVNLCDVSPATHLLSVRHYDRPGVLAHVLNGLKQEGINVQEMENVVFAGLEAAIARIHVDRAPSAGVLDGIQSSNADIMELKLLSLPKSPVRA